MRRTYRAAAFLLTVGIAMSLGGCATTAGEIGTQPVAQPKSPAASSSTEPSLDATAETTDAAHCLHGTWLADNDYFLAAMQDFGDAIDKVTGRVTLTFSRDDTLATEYSDWLLSGTDEGAAVSISRIGIDTGVYSISDGTVTIEETSVSSGLTVTAAGAAMSIAPVPVFYSNAAFTCDEASASISTPDGTILLTRN